MSFETQIAITSLLETLFPVLLISGVVFAFVRALRPSKCSCKCKREHDE